MDNLTHTLIGVMAGEGLAQTGFARHRRIACVATVAIASNLPDIDLFYTYVGKHHDKLSYMLDHRGHTHTLIGCVVLASALYLLAALLLRSRGTLTRDDHLLLGGSALLGTLLHLSMDALNSYGVHPFWPVQNRWFYGDSVFIVEPLYWVATAPLLFVYRSIVARILIGLVLAAAIALSVRSGMVPTALCVALGALMLILLFVASRASPQMAASLGIATTLGVTIVFIAAGALAAHRVESLAASRFPSAQTLDHVLTPMPANPFCWDLILLQRQGDNYTARHAMLSLAPSLMSVKDCPVRAGERQTASRMKPVAADESGIRWLADYWTSVAALRASVRSSCIAARAAQFLRAPFIARHGGATVIGDLRYDRELGLGFTELALGVANARCPRPAPWVPPREDLLVR